MKLIVVAVVSLSLQACVAPGKGFELNSPRNMATGLDDAVLYDAVLELTDAQGWQVMRASARTRWIEAHEPVDTSQGLVSRQRWVFHIDGGIVSAQMFLDFKKDGRWKVYPVVCDTYDYTAEFAMLESIETAAYDVIASAK